MKVISSLFLFLTLGWFNCFGQLNKGTLLLGGNIRYTNKAVSDDDLRSVNNHEGNQKEFVVGPRAGIFLKNNLAVGLLLNYEHQKQRNWDEYNNLFYGSQTQILKLGPFIRYYHFIVPELAVFGQGAITYNYNFNSHDTFVFTANVSPGLTYFITPKLGLEMNLGGISYTRGVYKPNKEDRATSNLIDLQLISGLQIGGSFYLSR
ncbi:hypothetical protein HUW51_12460 [Adhaeribacter swui]|uniref:Outer membrane beta-barrel protein n=1 Tax=Adhaeribacter swui TaxID=2086471 RepID=A0A7G7G8K8_9BACT|nr:hypothetical protein [Adhaeribacter swui]QNF33492.1 hypothetical protein HUW51_12460 [Adhaeribacter swui]